MFDFDTEYEIKHSQTERSCIDLYCAEVALYCHHHDGVILGVLGNTVVFGVAIALSGVLVQFPTR